MTVVVVAVAVAVAVVVMEEVVETADAEMMMKNVILHLKNKFLFDNYLIVHRKFLAILLNCRFRESINLFR